MVRRIPDEEGAENEKELYQDLIFNEILTLARDIDINPRKNLDLVHNTETQRLQDMIKNTPKFFSNTQKSMILMHLAAYSRDVGTLLDSL